MADGPVAAPAAPSAAPATDALSWMNDDSNFAADSPAAQKAFDLPTPARGPRPVLEDLDGLTGEKPGTGEKFGDEQTKAGEKTAREALAEQLGTQTGTEKEGAAAEPGYTQDEKGRWHRPDGAFADADEVAAVEEVLAGGRDPAKPGSVAPAAEKTGSPIPGVVILSDGKPVETVPALTFTYKANGKTYENVGLDKLIRKAQWGEGAERQAEEAASARQQFEATRGRLAELEAANKQFEDYYAKVLTDEAFYRASQQQLIQQQSPEARLAESQRQLQVIAQQQQEQTARNQATAYVQVNIAPHLDRIAASLPQDDVTQNAFYGKTAFLITPYLVNGRVPPDRLPDVARVIAGPLSEWAEQLVATRTESATAETAQLRKQVEATKVALTLAKKQAARSMAPKGRAGALRETPKPLPAPKSAEEANERMFASIEQQFGGAPPG